MADLLSKIKEDLKKAQKNKEETKVSILRMLLAEIKNEEIALKKKEGLTDDEVLSVIQRNVKRHKDSIESFKKGKREDLVEKEEEELKILKNYLPEELSEEELEKIVSQKIEELKASGPSDFGKVMGAVMAEVKGRAEGKKVAQIVKEKLG